MKLFMWLLYRSPGKKHTSSNIVVIVYLILYTYCVSHSMLSLLIWHSVLLYNNYTVVIFYLMSYFLQSSFSTSSSSSRRSTSSSSTSRCSSGRSSSSFSSTKRLVKSVWLIDFGHPLIDLSLHPHLFTKAIIKEKTQFSIWTTLTGKISCRLTRNGKIHSEHRRSTAGNTSKMVCWERYLTWRLCAEMKKSYTHACE